MRKQLLRLTSDSAVYGLGQALGRAVQLLLVPVLTRLLVPAEFGVAELVAGYLGSAVMLVVFGMDGALARFFYEQPDRDARVRMVSTSLVFRLIVSGAVAGLLIAFSGPLATVLFHGEAYRKYVWIGAATLPFTLLVMFGNDVLRVTFQPGKYIVLNLLQTVLITSLSILFVGRLHLSTAGVLYGRLVGDALSSLAGLLLIRHTLRFRFDRPVLRRMLAYGAPTVPATLAFAVVASLDRFMLRTTRTIEEVAVYSLAIRFYSVMTFAASAFQLAYGPFVYALHARDPVAPRLFARVLVGYVAVASLGAMVVGLFAPEILGLLVTRAYHPEVAALPALLLAFAAVALGAYTVTSIGIALALRTPLLWICTWSGALVGVACHLVLTPRIGVVGAATATLAGYLGIAVFTYLLAQRVYRLPYRGARAAGLFALALALALVAQHVAPPGIPGAVARWVVVLVYAAVCIWARVWTEQAAVAGG